MSTTGLEYRSEYHRDNILKRLKTFATPEEKAQYLRLVHAFYQQLNQRWTDEERASINALIQEEWPSFQKPRPDVLVPPSVPESMANTPEIQARVVQETLLHRNLSEHPSHEAEVTLAAEEWNRASEARDYVRMEAWLRSVYLTWRRNPEANVHRMNMVRHFEDAYWHTDNTFREWLSTHAPDVHNDLVSRYMTNPTTPQSENFTPAAVHRGAQAVTSAVSQVFYPVVTESTGGADGGGAEMTKNPFFADGSNNQASSEGGGSGGMFSDRNNNGSSIRSSMKTPTPSFDPDQSRWEGPLAGVQVPGDVLQPGSMRQAVFQQIRDVLVDTGIYRPCNRWRGSN